jgi:hypothetical protein
LKAAVWAGCGEWHSFGLEFDAFAVGVFVVVEVLRAECGSKVDDRGVGCSREGFYEGYAHT